MIRRFHGLLRGFQFIYSLKPTKEKCQPSNETCPLSMQNLSPEAREQFYVQAQLEHLMAQIVKVLGCTFADVRGEFYTAIYDKAKGIFEFPNSTLVFAMLEDAGSLAQEGFRLPAIQQKILAHEYVQDDPEAALWDIIQPFKESRKILWTIRAQRAAERFAHAQAHTGVSAENMLDAIERFNKACEAARVNPGENA